MTGYLVLSDGSVFEGERMGSMRDVVGELVFNTAMAGYVETLTDPSYFGQVIMQTYPLIGNYGVCREDFESDRIWAKGYVIKEYCDAPSNFRCQGTLNDLLIEQDIPAICGIDTRAVTRAVCEQGVMNCAILSEGADVDAAIKQCQSYRIIDAVESVTASAPVTVGEGDRHVVLWDFGAKRNIVRELNRRGYRVTIVPAFTKAAEIIKLKPDGVMLSNGPGDPADNPTVIEEIAKLWKYKVPMFGICLGHQLMALSRGAKTGKLPFGHRGAYQPVISDQGVTYVTSQNHGYEVLANSVPAEAKISFVNGRDGSLEGLDYPQDQAFSVQFHPEACPGPKDTEFLFDRFESMMK